MNKKINVASKAGKSQRAHLKSIKVLKEFFQEPVQNSSLNVAISLLLFKLAHTVVPQTLLHSHHSAEAACVFICKRKASMCLPQAKVYD